MNARIIVTMEDGQEVMWEGEGEDRDHCEGLAIAYAVEATGQQVLTIGIMGTC